MDRPDPRAILDSLSAEEILRELQELDAEQSALRVLLRAARARERGRQPRGEEERDAS